MTLSVSHEGEGGQPCFVLPKIVYQRNLFVSTLFLCPDCGIIKTDEPRTLDFSGVRGFLVTNMCIVQRSAA